MCNQKCNNMCNNQKCEKSLFSSKSMEIDLSYYIDELICDYIDEEAEMFKCKCCKEIEIKKDENYIMGCSGCELYLCISCFNNEELLEEEDIYIENRDEEEQWYICIECGCYCGECGLYKYEEDVRGLLDKDGDGEAVCCDCLNDGNLDFFYDGEIYNEKLCLVNKEEFSFEKVCKCCEYIECSDCEDNECEECLNNKKIGFESYKDLRFCNEDEEYCCEDCIEKHNHFFNCDCCGYDYNKNGDIISYNIMDDKVVCMNCVDLDLFYM